MHTFFVTGEAEPGTQPEPQLGPGAAAAAAAAAKTASLEGSSDSRKTDSIAPSLMRLIGSTFGATRPGPRLGQAVNGRSSHDLQPPPARGRDSIEAPSGRPV